MQFELPQQQKEPKPIKATPAQRKILGDRIRQNAAEQIETLRRSVPPKPQLNNFMIQALLNNEIEFKDIESIKTVFRKKAEAGLLCDSDGELYRVNVSDIFETNENFKAKLSEWQAINRRIQDEIHDISRTKDTLYLKIMAGSPEAVGKLVAEIDALGGELSLSIVNEANQNLLIGNGSNED